MRVHLTVLTLSLLAVVAALVVEGRGIALIVALGLGVLLAIGFPLLVILSERHDRPSPRQRP
jgi:Flp pilus assembly protein TadB